LEDELLIRFVPGPIRNAIRAQLARGLPGAPGLARRAVDWAQLTAQRLAYERRRSVLKMDTWLEDSLSFGLRDVG
jgi:hypothetical protein